MIAACMKWVALRPDVDPLDGVVSVDDRWSGPSPADEAALEWALRIAAARDDHVVVVTVGGPAADSMLRDAIACGAERAVRIIADAIAPASGDVARALAHTLRSYEPELVLCGDWSLDRGSGSVPPFLAAELGIGQACGLVGITIGDTALALERRLDGGRRERLLVDGRALLSVEGSTARLRRATLAGTLAAQTAPIELVTDADLTNGPSPTRAHVFRPRARILTGPDTDLSPRARAEQLLGTHSNRTPPQKLVLGPADAADRILTQLAAWGYTPPNTPPTAPIRPTGA